MADLSTLSDDQLKALYGAGQPKSPAQMSDAELQAAYQASKPKSAGDYASDIAKSAGIGLVNAGVGLAGLPGTLTDLAGRGFDYAFDKVAGAPTPEQAQVRENLRSSKILPSAANIQSGIESVTGPFYKPQTVPGEYARTIAEFAPGILTGPESMVTRAATQVLAPALASETAGQLTKGTAAEPYARVGGALAGGYGASKVAGMFVPPKVPSAEELKQAAQGAYRSPAVENLRIAPAAADQFVSDTNNALLANKVDPIVAPTVSKILDNLRSPRFDTTHTVSDFDLARQSLRDVPYNEARAASIARSQIDNFLNGRISPSSVVAGDVNAANSALSQARGNYAAFKRSEAMSDAMQRAQNQAASTYSGGNINNAVRQQLRPILNEKMGVSKVSGFEDFTPDELSQLKRATQGTLTGNVARAVGKLGPNGGLMGAGHLAAAFSTGGASIPVSLGTVAAKLIGNASTNRQVRILDEMLRSRSPLAQALLASAPKGSDPKLTAALAAALAANAQSARPIQSPIQMIQ